MQQTMVSSSVASGRSAARASVRRSPVKRLVVVADRKPLVVNAALATRAPPTFLQPVPWIEIFQALVLPAPVVAKPKPVAEEECPWIDETEGSHRHPMYFSHLADRMAMEPQDQ